jgi:tripartite-type tricarboxylate transporter receptor subunit TctC
MPTPAGIHIVASMLLLTAISGAATAQHYPARPIRIVVPFPPGGGSDVVARLVGMRVGELLRQTVVIDNRPGAAGVIGTEIVANAPGDGHTLLLASGSHSINASFGRKLPYDPVGGFTPVSRLATIPNVLVTHPGLAARSVKELIGLAQSKPGQINYASAGAGSTQHLAMELLKHAAKIDMTHVPYKGASPAEVDLLAGRIQIMFGTVPATVPHVKAGTLRALAVSSSRRSALLPDLPTIAESGVAGFEVVSWYGILGPRGVRTDIVGTLNTAIAEAVKNPELRDRLAVSGAEIVTSTPQQFGTFISEEIRRWQELARTTGLALQ